MRTNIPKSAILGMILVGSVGISGDGDTGSIGLGQFIHMVRRNVPMVYIIENNGVYGLTKGQFSATSDAGQVLKYYGKNELPALDLPLEDYQRMLQDARGHQLVYLEDFNREEDDDYLDRHLAQEGNDPLTLLEDTDLRRRLVGAIEHLPEREQLVMALYYDEELNLREIGEVLGVTESRVCQLHSQAVARLRACVFEGGAAMPAARRRGRPPKNAAAGR